MPPGRLYSYNRAMTARRLLAAMALTLALAAAPQAASAGDFAQEVAAGLSLVGGDSAEDGAPPASLPSRVDLSSQWADGPRDQAPLQSCHDFAAVALLEAGYFRAAGRRLRLSEADLFARATALRGARSVIIRENGLLREDLRFALAEGVLTGDGYRAFADRFKSAPRLTPLRGARAGLERIFPEAATPEASAERERVREELSGLRVGGPGFLRFFGSAARVILKGRGVRCRGRARRRDLLMTRLAGGQPVGIGLMLNGASDPDLQARRDPLGGEHYLVVTGYDSTPDGVVFSLRNSWDHRPGSDSKLPEADLCSLFGVSWISAPGEPD